MFILRSKRKYLKNYECLNLWITKSLMLFDLSRIYQNSFKFREKSKGQRQKMNL